MDSNFSRRNFLKVLGLGTAALALPGFDLLKEKKYVANIGIQLYTVRREIEKDFEGTMSKIAQMGYKGVETYALPAGITLERGAKVFRDAGLKVFGMHTELPVGAQRDQVLRFADAYKCDRVIYAGWPAEEKYKNADAIKHTADIYNETASFLKTKGLHFGLHNHWWEFEQADGIYPFCYMLEHLNREIFFEIDTYWAKTAGQDPAKIVHDFGRRAPLLHIKDGPAVKGEKGYEQVPVGKGAADIPSIVKAGGRHTEWMVVEFDEYKGDIFEGIKTSYDYLTGKGLAKGTV